MGYLRVTDVADRLGVNQSKIIAWIRRGELRAIDVSAHRGGKPRWRIPVEALEAFELARSNVATIEPRSLPRRRRRDPQVIQFF